MRFTSVVDEWLVTVVSEHADVPTDEVPLFPVADCFDIASAVGKHKVSAVRTDLP